MKDLGVRIRDTWNYLKFFEIKRDWPWQWCKTWRYYLFCINIPSHGRSVRILLLAFNLSKIRINLNPLRRSLRISFINRLQEEGDGYWQATTSNSWFIKSQRWTIYHTLKQIRIHFNHCKLKSNRCRRILVCQNAARHYFLQLSLQVQIDIFDLFLWEKIRTPLCSNDISLHFKVFFNLGKLFK